MHTFGYHFRKFPRKSWDDISPPYLTGNNVYQLLNLLEIIEWWISIQGISCNYMLIVGEMNETLEDALVLRAGKDFP